MMMENTLNEKELEQVSGGILPWQEEKLNEELHRAAADLMRLIQNKYKSNRDLDSAAFVFLLVLTIQNFNLTVREAYNILEGAINSSGVLADPQVKSVWDRIVTCMSVLYK